MKKFISHLIFLSVLAFGDMTHADVLHGLVVAVADEDIPIMNRIEDKDSKSMQRVPISRGFLNPCRANNFLDTCAFDPKYAPEDFIAKEIRSIGNRFEVNLLLAHSNQKEIDHPNTPANVKREAAEMIYTIATSLSSEEIARKNLIHEILTGNGKPEKYAADAAHVFEAGKYVGYFITTDDRILKKREELQRASMATILKPSEWLEIFNSYAVG